jgi:hypothetical protein
VPLGLTSLAAMARIARHYRGRFNTVVRAFQHSTTHVQCHLGQRIAKCQQAALLRLDIRALFRMA